MHSGALGFEIGTAQTGDQSLTCSSDLCRLYLWAWSLLGLQGKPGHREDGEVGGAGWQNGEWVWQRVHNDRFQWVVGVEDSG